MALTTKPVPAGAATGRGRLPVQSRDRRPALAALALLLVVIGALGAALVVYRSGQRVDVLMAAHTIQPGQQVTSSDFTDTRVSADSVTLVDASAEGSYIGAFAATAIPGGTLINSAMFQSASKILPSDSVVVGAAVPAANRPASPVEVGDVVQVYVVAGKASSSDESSAAGQVLIQAARVVGVASSASALGESGETVSLLVSSDNAPLVVGYSVQGLIALAELPVGTKPSPDLQTS